MHNHNVEVVHAAVQPIEETVVLVCDEIPQTFFPRALGGNLLYESIPRDRPLALASVRSVPDYARKINVWIQMLLSVKEVSTAKIGAHPAGDAPGAASLSRDDLRRVMLISPYLDVKDEAELLKLVHDYQATQKRSEEINVTIKRKMTELATRETMLQRNLNELVQEINVEFIKLFFVTGELYQEPMMQDEKTGKTVAAPYSYDQLKTAAGYDPNVPLSKNEVPHPLPDEDNLPLPLLQKKRLIENLRDAVAFFRTDGPSHDVMAFHLAYNILMVLKGPYRKKDISPDKLAKEIEFIRYERGFLEKAVLKRLDAVNCFAYISAEGYVTVKTRDVLFGLWVSFDSKVGFMDVPTYDVTIKRIAQATVSIAGKPKDLGLWGKLVWWWRKWQWSRGKGKPPEAIGLGREEVGQELTGKEWGGVRRFELDV